MSAIRQTSGKAVFVLLGMGFFGFLFLGLVWWQLTPQIVLALTIAGIGLVVLSLRPYLGVHVLIMTLFIENAFGGEERVSLMKVMGAVILGGWLVHVALERRTGLKFDGFVVVLVLFLVWCGVSLVYAIDTQDALASTFTYAQLAVAALMFSSVVDTQERIRGVYWSFAIWTTLSTLVAVAMYYLGLTPTARGLVENRNLLAAYINVGIICTYLLFQGSSKGLSRIVLVVALPVLFLGLGLTFSRAGLIVVVLTLLLVWYRVARQRKFLLLAGSIGMIGVLAYVLPAAFWVRAGSIVPAIRRQQDTFGARVQLWRVAERMIRDRPIFGVGPGNYVAAFPRYARGGDQYLQTLSTHNAFVGVTAENGLVGGALFLLVCGFALRAARRGVHVGRVTARSNLEVHSVVAEVSLLAVLLAGLSGDVEGLKILWIFFGLAVAMGRMAERAVSEKRPEPLTEPSAVPMDDVVPWALARPRQ